MGFPESKRLMAIQQEQEQARDESFAPRNKRKGSHCQQDCVADGSVDLRADINSTTCEKGEISQDNQAKEYSGPNLPEDIWCHIHSLMPLRDAARAACVSRAFKCYWRFYPKLSFSMETLCLDGCVYGNAEIARVFTSKVDHILENHSGMGMKTLELLGAPNYNAKDRCYLDRWLKKAITLVLEELRLYLSSVNNKYEFPCSLLLDGNAVSIRCLRLSTCIFRPTVGIGCLRSLTILNLFQVRITGDELGSFLSISFVLEQLQLRHCKKIRFLMIPCLLLRLNYLEVLYCSKLQVVESRALNLTCSTFEGDFQVQLSHRAASQMKTVCMGFLAPLIIVGAKLASSMPNLQSLAIFSSKEMAFITPISNKFLHLKYLNISLSGATSSLSYDYFSLASFFDASPSLETFILDAWQPRTEHVLASADPSEPREMLGHNHENLKNVRIYGFSSTKSLVELTCHIVQITTSLEWLVLDTKEGHAAPDCSVNKTGKCFAMPRENIAEAHKALLAVQTYVKPKVPSTVHLLALGPCNRCHVVDDL